MISFIVSILLIVLVLRNNHLLFKNKESNRRQYIFLQILAVYHFIFAYIFYQYILNNGGDAISYWSLHKLNSNDFEEWKGVWGTGTFFIETLNYFPSRVFKLDFLTGTFLYATFSFYALRNIFLLFSKRIESVSIKYKYLILIVLFFSPNLHFWASGVSKEALILIALSFLLVFLDDPKIRLKDFFISIFLALMTRPVVGVVFLFIGLVFLSLNSRFQRSTYLFQFFLLILLGLFSFLVFQMTHVEQMSWSGLMQYREQQFEFLKNQHAASEVPMDQLPLINQIFTILFSPFLVFNQGIWYAVSSLENFVSLGAISIGILIYLKKPIRIPMFLIGGLLIFCLINFIHLMSINNLGIMMRLKSPLMIIPHLTAAFVIVQQFKMNVGVHE